MVLDMTAWNRRWRDDVWQRAHCVRRSAPAESVLFELRAPSATDFAKPRWSRPRGATLLAHRRYCRSSQPRLSHRENNTPNSRSTWRTLQRLLDIGARIDFFRPGIIFSYLCNGQLFIKRYAPRRSSSWTDNIRLAIHVSWVHAAAPVRFRRRRLARGRSHGEPRARRLGKPSAHGLRGRARVDSRGEAGNQYRVLKPQNSWVAVHTQGWVSFLFLL